MAYSIQAKFFKFAKKINSTKRPVEQPSTMLERSVEIIEPFDLLNPTIKVVDCWTDATKDTWTYFMQFNYVKLGDTSDDGREVDRYYWIKNWRRERGVNYAECEVDVLASWRGTIHGYERHPNMQLIERTSKAADYHLTDPMRPKTMNTIKKTITSTGGAGSWSFSDPTAIFMMYPSAAITQGGSIVYSPGNVFGGSKISRDAFMAHISDVLWYNGDYESLNPDNPYGLSSGQAVKDFVADYYMLPYEWSHGTAAYSVFAFGDWDFTISQPKKKSGGAVRFELDKGESLNPMTDITAIKLVASWTYPTSQVLSSEYWLNTSEYVNLELTIQPFGTLTIPIDLLQFGTHFAVQIHGDIQGNVILSIKCGDRITVLATSNVRYVDSYKYAPRSTVADVNQTQRMANFGHVVNFTNAVTDTAMNWSTFASNSIGAVYQYMSSSEAALKSIAVNSYPSGVMCTGISGSTLISDPVVTLIRYEVTPAMRDKYGYPYHKYEALGDHVKTDNNPGFVQCCGANMDNIVEDYTTYGRNGSASITVTEKQAICNYLNGGVYLE